MGVILYIFGMCNSSCLKISMGLHVSGVSQKHVRPILYTQSYLVSLILSSLLTCVSLDTTLSKEYRTESILVKLMGSPGLDYLLNRCGYLLRTRAVGRDWLPLLYKYQSLFRESMSSS